MDANSMLQEQVNQITQQLELEIATTQMHVLRSFRESREWASDPGPIRTGDGYNSSITPRNPLALPFRGRVDLNDSANGKFFPYYETEEDIWRTLAIVRNLFTFDAMTIGASQALRSYVISGEWRVEVRDDDQEETDLALRVSAVIDNFLDRNDWWETILPDLHDNGRRDGEQFIALYPDGDTSAVELLSPENCREPRSGIGKLNAELSTHDASWFFGIHCRRAPYNNRIDWTRPLGFYFQFDEAGSEWEYLPSWPQPLLMEDSRCCIHYKRNAPTTAARGVSDYYQVAADLENNWKLSRNLTQGGAVQAAIAGVIKRAGTTRVAALSDVVGNAADTIERLSSARGSGMSVNRRKFEPGTIIETDSNSEYMHGPLGTTNSGEFVEIANHGGRRLGTRWNMPEYLITGDASNNNLASSLAATSPFVKYVIHQQSGLKLMNQRVLWRVLRIAWDAGRFSGLESDWKVFERRVALDIISPKADMDKPTAADASTSTTRMETLFRNRIISGKTWATEEGYPEEDAVEAPPADEQVDPVTGTYAETPPASGEYTELGQRHFNNNLKRIKATLDSLIAGDISQVMAEQTLQAIGLTPDRVAALIDDARDGSVDDPDLQAAATTASESTKPTPHPPTTWREFWLGYP